MKTIEQSKERTESEFDVAQRDGRAKLSFRKYLMFTLAKMIQGGGEFLLIPVLSHALSAQQYGKFVLAMTGVLFASDAAALWASTSYVRLSTGLVSPIQQRNARSALLLGTYFVSGVLAVIFWTWIAINPRMTSDFSHVLAALIGLAILVFATVTFAMGDFQAHGLTGRYCLVIFVRASAPILGGVAAIFLVGRTANAVLAGSIFFIALAMTPYTIRAPLKIESRNDAVRTIREAAKFGPGMWLQNLGGRVLRVGDRYAIGAVAGSASVAIYSANYNLYYSALMILISPIIVAITPVMYATYDHHGETAAKQLLDRLTKNYVYFGAIALGLVFMGSRIVFPFLLPDAYSRAFSPAMIILLLAIALIHGMSMLLGLVFGIRKLTMISAGMFIAAGLLNIVANVILVPVFGIAGAVVASLVSYSALFLATAGVCRRLLGYQLPLSNLVVASLIVLAICSVAYLPVDNAWLRTGLGTLVLFTGAGIGCLLSSEIQETYSLVLNRSRSYYARFRAEALPDVS